MKQKFGYMPCPDCPERVVVHISDFKTLSYSCQECGGNGYCKTTQPRYQTWVAKINPEGAARAPREKKPAADPAPVPVPAKKTASGTII